MTQTEIIPAEPKKPVKRERSTEVAMINPTPEALMAQAIEKGLPIDTIERFMLMRKELKAEAAKEAFDEAMADFQGECPVIEKVKKVDFKTRQGDAVKYEYAPMDEIIRQIKGPLAKNGFSYTFKLEELPNGVKATCIVKHKAGHSESSDFTAQMAGTSLMSSAQVTASKSTYAKRQALTAALGIATADEDNDAPKSKEEEKAGGMATPEQKNEIDLLAQRAGVTKAEVATRCRAEYGVSILEITQTQAMGIIDRLNLKIKKMTA